jgi:CheY-like chemotaxis protein
MVGPIPDHFNLCVLLVEDNAVNQRLMQRVLTKLGCTWELAANGRLALEALAARDFDVVLMDLHMPEMDGYALVRQLRAEEPPGQRRPLLALTANALKGEAARALEAGLDDCLTKPIAMASLQAALTRWLPPAAPQVQAGAAAATAGEPHAPVPAAGPSSAPAAPATASTARSGTGSPLSRK